MEVLTENVIYKHIIKVGKEFTYIFTEDEKLLKHGNSHTYIMPCSLYYIVQKYIESNKELLSVLMKPLSNGNVPYWEIDFREHVIRNILRNEINIDLDRRQVSNALSAFEL